MEKFDPEYFVEARVEELRKIIGKERALVAVSGGVDSTTCAVLTHMATGENLVCVILDDAFMRTDEPEYVADVLCKPPFNVPARVVDVRERFLEEMKGLRDAEEKRKKFQATFYQVLSETAKEENCSILVQGTIRADIEETVAGVKTQHNVLQQMGIDPIERFGWKVVEPLAALYKGQVRVVARILGLPSEFSERQPFPGPGLSVRVVGEIRPDKLDAVKKATAIVEDELAQYEPSQYFAVIIDQEQSPGQSGVNHIQNTIAQVLNAPIRDVEVTTFRDKATGVRGGKRQYGQILGIKVLARSGKILSAPIKNLLPLQAEIITENPAITRCLYTIKDLEEIRSFAISIRSVETRDFLKAQVSEIPWPVLDRIAEMIIEKCLEVSSVYYDITPKPPATIEME